jgi:hypothetical protein
MAYSHPIVYCSLFAESNILKLLILRFEKNLLTSDMMFYLISVLTLDGIEAFATARILSLFIKQKSQLWH